MRIEIQRAEALGSSGARKTYEALGRSRPMNN